MNDERGGGVNRDRNGTARGHALDAALAQHIGAELTPFTTALSDHYAIERELGRGGMATVYLARDVKHDRLVALKVLDPELGAVLGGERFLTEIRVTANLQHPHLLPLFDSGETNGLLWYVMPYVEGESLRARLEREKQLPIDEAVRIAAAVAQALDYAHSHGVIHRDLKPENILLQAGQPVVADFGIALAVSNAGGHRITQTGLSLGTPQYMSPEQATGDRVIDGRSDIYSLGAVLYEMLAGEPPHVGGSAQAIIARLVTEPPRALTTVRSAVPARVDQAVSRALEKVPADRFENARAFAAALEGTGESEKRVRTLVSRRALPPSRSSRAVRLAILGIVGAAAAFGGWRFGRRASDSGEVQLARQLTFEGDVIGEALSPDGAWLAYITDDCLGQAQSCGYSLKVREVDGTQAVHLLTWPQLLPQVRWSSDGATLAFIGSPDATPASAYLVERLGGSPRRVPGSAAAIAFADGKHVAIVHQLEDRVSIVHSDVTSLAVTDSVLLPSWIGSIRELSYDPSGRYFAATAVTSGVSDRRLMLLLMRPDGEVLDSLSNVPAGFEFEATGDALDIAPFSPGTALNVVRLPIRHGHFAVGKSRVRLGHSAASLQTVPIGLAVANRIAILVDGQHPELRYHRIADPSDKWTSVTSRTGFLQPDELLANDSLLAQTTDNLGDNLYLFPIGGGTPRAITSLRGGRSYGQVSPNGHLAVYLNTSDSVVITDVAGGPERHIALGNDLVGWADNDRIVLAGHRSIVLVDTTGVRIDSIVVPDSLALSGLYPLVHDAARRRFAFWSIQAAAVVAVDLDTRRTTLMYPPPAGATAAPLAFTRDGGMLVLSYAVVDPRAHLQDSVVLRTPAAADGSHAQAHPTQRDAIIRVSPSGVASSVGAVPPGCVTPVASVTGDQLVCGFLRSRPDVWLAEEPGRGGWW